MRIGHSAAWQRSMCLLGVASSLAAPACRPAAPSPGESESKFTTLDSLRCGGFGRDGRCGLYSVSIYELLANPLRFDGKRVRLIGFAHFEFEGNALYPHRDDWDQRILRNGLWLHPPPHGDSLSDHYVLVEARFRARPQGHLGLWSGTLDSVTRLVRWEPPHEPPHKYKIIQPLKRP